MAKKPSNKNKGGRTEPAEQKKPRLSPADRMVAALAGIMVLVLLALGVLRLFRLLPIHGEVRLFLPLLLVFTLLGWGVSALVRRISRTGVRRFVAVLLGTALLVLAVVAFNYVALVAAVTVPQPFDTVAAPSGARRLAVLRRVDDDDARIEARHQARLEADPDADPEVTVDDWGYAYSAHPTALRFFYRADADVEGEVWLSYHPVGTLMMQWSDDERQVRFYAQNPGPGEGGECFVRFP